MIQFQSFVAMAGLAEQAEFFAMFIAWGGLVAAAAIGIYASSRSSLTLAVVAIVLLLGVSLLFRPWFAFAPITAEQAEDPDLVDFYRGWRFFAVVWCFTVLAVTTCCVTTARRRQPTIANSAPLP